MTSATGHPSMVSTVIVAFDSSTHLPACLQSLKSQDDVTVETIVVDNASQDGSASTARREAPDARIIELERNVGYAAGNNSGIRCATAEWILLLNPDCRLRRGALRALVDFGATHQEAGAIGAKLLNPDGTLQPSGRPFPTLGRWWMETTGLYRLKMSNANLDPRRNYDVPCEVDEVSGACMLLRRRALDQVGLLDERFFLLWEDVDLCKRLRQAGWKVYYCADAPVVHEFGASRKHVSEFVRRVAMQSAEYYFRKHHGVFAFAAVRCTHVAKECLRRLTGGFRRSTRAGSN